MHAPDKHIFDVKVADLEALDKCATDERTLLRTVPGADAVSHEEALLAAADAYPAASQVLPLLKPNHPGYVYAQVHRRIMRALSSTGPDHGESAASRNQAGTGITTGTDAARPQQPL